MSKELPYFKFYVSEWSNGNITLEDYATQGLFINLCAYYWSKGGNITLENAMKKFKGVRKKHFENLISANIIQVNDKLLTIKFMDLQIKEYDGRSKKNRENALEGWKQRKSDATALQTQSEKDANAMPIRIREDKKKSNSNSNSKNPSIDDFISYAIDRKYKEHVAEKAWHYYENSGWVDKEGNEIKNWKNKLNNVWFKEQHKIKEEPVTSVNNSAIHGTGKWI